MTTSTDTITVFEDRTSILKEYNQHQDNLYKLRDVIGPKNFVLQTDGQFRIMHYVGFFQRGKTRVQILPKIWEKNIGSDEEERGASIAFIYRLLCWTGYLKSKHLSPQAIGHTETDLLEIFINLFILEFNKLFQRKQFRRYEERIENQQFIKGKILFADSIRTNPILRHRHIVRFDDYTINNPLNQVFKSMMQALLRITKSGNNKKELVIGLNYLDDVDEIALSSISFNSIKFNRLNSDFEPLFNMAKLFFTNRQPGMNEGNEYTFSFLVPINALFEVFVSKLLLSFTDEKYVFHYHENSLNLLIEGNSKVMQLKPDYAVTRDGTFVTIMDAKYKSPYGQGNKIDLKESDVYQLCTYGLRYNIRNLFLIYPKLIGAQNLGHLLADYRIEVGLDSKLPHIKLRVIQIDITEESIEVIKQSLKENVYNLFIDEVPNFEAHPYDTN